MRTNNSFKTIKWMLPIVALLTASVVFAFSSKPTKKQSVSTQVWLKYDCSTGEPDLSGSTNISFTDNSAPCTGPSSNPICSERYTDISDLEPVPGHPDFYQPKQESEPEATFYCE